MGNKTINRRFKLIFYSTGLRKSEFASLLGRKPIVFDNYFKNKFDYKNILYELGSLGFSVDWLLFGTGEMVNEEFKNKKYDILNPDYSLKNQKANIQYWISLNFNNLKEFESKYKFRENELKYCFRTNSLFEYKLLKSLWASGCNVKWTINRKGSMFLKNSIGVKMKNKYLRNKDQIKLPPPINFNYFFTIIRDIGYFSFAEIPG